MARKWKSKSQQDVNSAGSSPENDAATADDKGAADPSNPPRPTSRSTVALEPSISRPSRKSTRKSANHGKPSQGKERNAVAQSVTPKARAMRERTRH